MRIFSWNLNGLQSCVKNCSFEPLKQFEPEIICLQEIRTKEELEILPGYQHIWNHGDRDGYAGTAMLCKAPPLHIEFGLEDGKTDPEGRTITAEYPDFFLVNAYVPNSQQNLQRHAYRMQWDELLCQHVCILKDRKPVILCGDFNVAWEDIDIYPENLRQYWASQGYASDERSDLETLLEAGFCDAYRELYPSVRNYTWWSNRLNKRRENRGWRLDYFIVDRDLMPCVQDVIHHAGIMGSDHCPIELEADL